MQTLRRIPQHHQCEPFGKRRYLLIVLLVTWVVSSNILGSGIRKQRMGSGAAQRGPPRYKLQHPPYVRVWWMKSASGVDLWNLNLN